MNVIETSSLSKFYGENQVLHSVNMHVKTGQLVGFLGPNGAGKSTTIRILMGLLSFSSGSARIFGLSVEKSGKQIRADIGYLPGDVHLYSNMTGLSLLKFYAAARKVDCLAEALRLADVFDLELNKNIRKYSTGMRQKLGLIQALMHKPRLLVLDEPTSALDPLIRGAVFDELQRVTRDGRTVLFSSHSLDEVESLCDEVIILRAGKVVEQQNIEALKDRALRKVSIVFAEPQQHLDLPPNLKVFQNEPLVLTGTWSGEIKPLLQWIQLHMVIDVIIERPDLNDLFISYYTDELGGQNV